MSSKDSLKEEEILSFEIESDPPIVSPLDEKLISNGAEFTRRPCLGYVFQLLYILFLCFQ